MAKAIYRFTQAEREVRNQAKADFGVNYLMSYNADPKTRKSNQLDGWYQTITYMLPHRLQLVDGKLEATGPNVCTDASEFCANDCMLYAGSAQHLRGKLVARHNRKQLMFRNKVLFEALLRAELNYHRAHAHALGRTLVYRGNGTSDNPLEVMFPALFGDYGDVVFTDYTKNPRRMAKYLAGSLPANYHLTFSRSEDNGEDCERILGAGGRVAIVFSTPRTKPLPTAYDGRAVVDQDTDDLTFLRDGGQWLGLRAKGRARQDRDSGFVVQVSK